MKWMSIQNTGSTPLLYPGGLGNKCLHSGGPFLTTGSKTQPTNPVFRNGNFETGIRILTVTWWTPLLVWNATRPAHKLLREISQPQADPVYIFRFFSPCCASARFRVMASRYGASSAHSLDAPNSVGLLWTSDRPDAETSTWQYATLTRDTSLPTAGFELAIPTSERPQTHALDLAATGTGTYLDTR